MAQRKFGGDLGTDPEAYIPCPTCMADEAFNVTEPTVSLVMCELVSLSDQFPRIRRNGEK